MRSGPQSVEKLVFDRLPAIKKVPKTSPLKATAFVIILGDFMCVSRNNIENTSFYKKFTFNVIPIALHL
jgi:hypothetical protein